MLAGAGRAFFVWAGRGVMTGVFPPLDAAPPVSALTPKLTTEPAMQLLPVNARVSASPSTPLVGVIEVSVGTGMLTVKVCAVVVPPPGAGVVTNTLTLPAMAISAAVIAAVSCLSLTNVVVFATPLKFTTDVVTKFPPFTVSAKPAPPTVALEGEKLVTDGTPALSFNANAAGVAAPDTAAFTV